MIASRTHEAAAILREIARLVELAEMHGEIEPATGKRKWTRFAEGMLLDVTSRLAPPAPVWPVVMHNVCERGFAFWLKRPMDLRAGLFVREFSAENSRLWLTVYVTHCTRGICGFLVGVGLAIALPESN
ncbi:MAG: hypothetical protein HY763_00770 [Planctomycetes bacterium]|nr:hypothetical protein [Planctomycetota bacterium]